MYRSTGGLSAAINKKDSTWRQLPDDLLVAVYRRLTCPLDRVRFTAVCKPWRGFFKSCPPPLPMLVLSRIDGDGKKTLYSPADGGIVRLPLPCKVPGERFVGSYDGGWVAASTPELVVFNLFTGEEVELSPEQRTITADRPLIRKIVFSEAPTSSGCILAAMTTICNVAVCRIGCKDGGWTTTLGCETTRRLKDMAFCGGALYGITYHGDEVLKFDVHVGAHGAPAITETHYMRMRTSVAKSLKSTYDCFVMELRGKLAMATWIERPRSRSSKPRIQFRVFELAGDRWADVRSLDGYALFVGPICSKAVYLSDGGRGGVERNRVYYSNDRIRKHNFLPQAERLVCSDIAGRHVFARKDKSVGERIGSEEYYIKGVVKASMWLLPQM